MKPESPHWGPGRPSRMVEIGPSLLHVGDWREGSSGGQGWTTAQSTDHTGSLRSSVSCPLPGRLPSSSGLLLPPALLRCCSASAVEPFSPRQCCSQRGAAELWQVSKVEGRVVVSIFQQERLPGKELLLCPESCPSCFPNSSPHTPIPPTASATGRK